MPTSTSRSRELSQSSHTILLFECAKVVSPPLDAVFSAGWGTCVAAHLFSKLVLLLADEPTGTLGTRTSQDVMNFFHSLNEYFYPLSETNHV